MRPLRRLPPARLPLLAAVAALVPLTAGAADFLPAVSLHLEAARYVPAETDLHWTGTMGGGADVLGIGGFRAYVVGEVETIIGNTRRGFDATQANYSLETGGRWRRRGLILNPFFHHVSRHLSDREKAPGVDWNMLGVRADATLGPGRRARVGGSVGHTTLASLVGYRWELTGHGDVELIRRGRTAGYAAARARLVTIEPEPRLVRGDFLDWAVEGGARYTHERRVFLLVPGARDRGLFGIRILLHERD
jgi:hypothetical protein